MADEKDAAAPEAAAAAAGSESKPTAPIGSPPTFVVVTTLEGPASSGIASRIGGFGDVEAMERSGTGSATQIIQAVLSASAPVVRL